MPLKEEQVPELHGKMPNVTSETVEKILSPEVNTMAVKDGEAPELHPENA